MIKLRDHYFIAWLKVVKGKEIFLSKDGIYVNINKSEYRDALEEYDASLKPVLKEVRKIVKELASFSSKNES